MTAIVQSIVDELTKRFVESNFKEISITMKCNNEEITITPCTTCSKASSMSDIEYFLVGCSLPWLSNDTLEKVATDLANYENLLKESADEEKRLEAYFNQHIKGHTGEELSLGNDFSNAAYSLWERVPEELKKEVKYVFDEKLDDFYLAEYRKEHSIPLDVLKRAYDLANHFSYYSDWFKDVHGYRPRSLNYYEG